MCCHGSPPNTVGMYLGGFVFPVFTKRLGQSCSEAQDAGVFGFSVGGAAHTGREGKLILDDNSVQGLSCCVTSTSYWLEC